MKKHTSFVLALLTMLAIWTNPVVANDAKIGDITITGIWARATAASAKTGAAYMMLKNTGSADDKLVRVRSNVAKKTEIHESLMENDIMKMRHIGVFSIPAGKHVALKPGAKHIMFMGLKAPFKLGDTFPITLIFEKAGEIEIQVMIRKGSGMKQMKHKM